MVNRATLIGNVGKDPEIRNLDSGSKVATFPLATNERWTDKTTGEKKEKTEWHRIVVWGDDLITKLVQPYISKGSKLFIEGKISTRQWEKDGDARYATEIVVQGLAGTIQLLDRKEGGREEPPPHEREPEGRGLGQPQQRSAPPPPSGVPYQDIPF